MTDGRAMTKPRVCMRARRLLLPELLAVRMEQPAARFDHALSARELEERFERRAERARLLLL